MIWNLTQGINPGPVMGMILYDLEEAQAAGEVHNREEAISFVTNWKTSHETLIRGVC